MYEDEEIDICRSCDVWKSHVEELVHNQAAIAISSGEAGYYALVKAGSVSLGGQAIMHEMGIHLEGRLIKP